MLLAVDATRPLPLVLFACFILISLLELFCCATERNRTRKIFKAFCVPLLALSVALYAPKAWMVYVGLLFGAAGDIALIEKKSIANYAIGLGCFFINHVFFIAQVFSLLYPVPPFYLVACCLLLAAGIPLFALLWYQKCNIRPLGLTIAGGFYAMMVVSEVICPLLGLILTGNPLFLFGVAGGITFAFSDTTLVISNFISKVKKSHLIIMGTYLLSQALIALELVFLIL